jgi:hypothetical protein
MTNTLEAGTFLKAAGFSRAFPLDSVQSCAREYGEDEVKAWDRAVANRHETAYAINIGTALTDEPMAVKDAKRAKAASDFANATVVATGDVFLIEGVEQVCRVNGEKFSDAIVFRPL